VSALTDLSINSDSGRFCDSDSNLKIGIKVGLSTSSLTNGGRSWIMLILGY
jgi:hypothetical protein